MHNKHVHSFCRCVWCAHAQFLSTSLCKEKSFPSNAWLCSCFREITRNDYQTLSSLYINETMKQCWSLPSQCVIVSQINYLPQPLASQISVLSDQIYWCCPYSLLTSVKYTSPLVQRPLQTLILLHVLFFWRNLCLCLKCAEPTKVSVTSRFKAKPWFFKISLDDLFCNLQCRRPMRAS